MRRLIIVLVMAGACGGGGQDAETRKQLDDCVKTLQHVGAGAPSMQLPLLAEGCGAGVPALAGYAMADPADRGRMLAEKGDLVCDAAKPKVGGEGNPWHMLAQVCGPARYGLAAGQESLMSPEWSAAYLIGKRMAQLRKGADGELAARFDSLVAEVRIPLPIPAAVDAAYTVADRRGQELAGIPVEVVVGRDGKLRAGTAPVATIDRDGAHVGAGFPGNPVELAALDGRIAELERSARPGTPAGALSGAKQDRVEAEPEEEPEEVVEEDLEEGGTGTAMALDEGKMGKRDTRRETGQYSMERREPDPQLARKQAIEKAREAGILGAMGDDRPGPPDLVVLADAGAPAVAMLEVARHVGDRRVGVAVGRGIARLHPVMLVMAEPVPPATGLGPTGGSGEGTIGLGRYGTIGHGGGTGSGYGTMGRPGGTGTGYGYGARPPRGDAQVHTEVRFHVTVRKDGLDVESNVGDTLVFPRGAGAEWPPSELPELFHRWYSMAPTMHLIIGARPEATVEDVVTVLDAAATAGMSRAEALGADTGSLFTGAAPESVPLDAPVEAERARASVPSVRIGNADAVGDLDKNIIRRYIRRALPRIKYCYEKRLLVKPDLGGTVSAEFTISPTGTVFGSKASGVDGEVSACVAEVISSIEFPKPKGGGIVKVSSPFTFKSAGD